MHPLTRALCPRRDVSVTSDVTMLHDRSESYIDALRTTEMCIDMFHSEWKKKVGCLLFLFIKVQSTMGQLRMYHKMIRVSGAILVYRSAVSMSSTCPVTGIASKTLTAVAKLPFLATAST